MENLTVLCTKDIVDLDQEIKGMTLWEYILAYKSTHTGKNLIHTINKSQSYWRYGKTGFAKKVLKGELTDVDTEGG